MLSRTHHQISRTPTSLSPLLGALRGCRFRDTSRATASSLSLDALSLHRREQYKYLPPTSSSLVSLCSPTDSISSLHLWILSSVKVLNTAPLLPPPIRPSQWQLLFSCCNLPSAPSSPFSNPCRPPDLVLSVRRIASPQFRESTKQANSFRNLSPRFNRVKQKKEKGKKKNSGKTAEKQQKNSRKKQKKTKTKKKKKAALDLVNNIGPPPGSSE